MRIRTWGGRQDWIDLALALGLAIMACVELGTGSDFHRAHGALAIALGLATTLPLAVRRRAPLAVAAVVLAALIAQVGLRQAAPFGTYFATLLTVFTLGSECRLRTALITAALVGAAVTPHLFDNNNQPAIGDVIFTYGPMLIALGGGHLMRRRTVRIAALETDLGRAEAAAVELARRAVDEERSRIARELHDVVAHG